MRTSVATTAYATSHQPTTFNQTNFCRIYSMWTCWVGKRMAECACRNEHRTKEITMNATTTKNPNRRLQPGTLVVNTEDGEPGNIQRVCTYRRNGIDAYSYTV